MKQGVQDAKKTQPQTAISGAISPAGDRFSRPGRRPSGLFLDVLGKDADIVTLRCVAGQVTGGRAMTDVRIELATSAEARTAVNQIYRDVLRRDAAPSCLNAQMAGLRSGLTLSRIRQAIADSPEGRARR